MNLSDLEKDSESNIKSLFGLPKNALGELLLTVLPVIDERRKKQQESKTNRQRKVGGGRHRLLKPYQEVLLTLLYLRHNVAFGVVGRLFGVSADVAENTYHDIVQVLRDTCPASRWDAEKRWTKKEPSWKPSEIDKVIIDSFETPIPRPSIEPKQKDMYSGKKKDHTLKTEVICTENGDLLDIDPGYRGPKSDKKLHEESAVAQKYPNAIEMGDLGYKGLMNAEVPHKKPRGGELTAEQKEENRKFSSTRVRVEHTIRRMKAFRIVRDDYRLATGLFKMNCCLVAGLNHLIAFTS